MLRLPEFEVRRPETVQEVVRELQNPGARIVAGGTDILPNLKHRLDDPPVLISLSRVRALQSVEVESDRIRIGAGVTLRSISDNPEIQQHFPSLAEAASLVASPLIRNMGTLGGNINLDTRCRYVNQTSFWRESLGGGCLKSEGNVCHVVPKGRNCVAAMSSDCVPVLISLQATAVLEGPQGRREIPLEEYFTANGIAHTKREDGEIMTEVQIPKPPAGLRQRGAYEKWSLRKSIDFPLVSVALCFALGEEDRIAQARVVVGVLGSRPRVVKGLDELNGETLASTRVEEHLASAVYKQCKPLGNVPYEAQYRREMIPVYTKRALRRIIESP